MVSSCSAFHGMNPQTVVGAYVRRGQMLCEIVDESHVRVAAPLTTAQAEPLIQTPPDKRHVEIRAISKPDDVIHGTSLRVIEAGQKALPHAALSYGGGGSVETDPQDKTGMTAPQRPVPCLRRCPQSRRPGERVRLRVSLPWRPLLWQWVERVERMIQGRVGYLMTQAFTRYNALFDSIRSRRRRNVLPQGLDAVTQRLRVAVNARKVTRGWLESEAKAIDALSPQIRNHSEAGARRGHFRDARRLCPGAHGR
jgi:hypothetical protein